MELIVPALFDFAIFRGGGGACMDFNFDFFRALRDRERGNGGAFLRSAVPPAGPLGRNLLLVDSNTPDVQMGGGKGLKCF